MRKQKLRFRQVHLDFHTSPLIPAIGESFDRKQWQETLQAARVNSITCFAKCHHGWSYHPTRVGKMHPHLTFDLLRAQFEACKEIDVNVPIYLSAGIDNLISYEHPEWRETGPDGRYIGWTIEPLSPGFHTVCFHSPYLDYLCDQIRETVRLFPNADGIFLDIISQGQCCCRWCLAAMEKAGLDPTRETDRIKNSRLALEQYYQRTVEAIHDLRPNMPVFHNSGHIRRGDHATLRYFSHLELESLPTGGWGYDHFPISAKYCKGLGLDFLGMTGKFHTTWGEFGGFKHPNALRYECAAMLAFGSKCSVGDQLHPCGALDPSTYGIIGEAYREVEQKEPWCDDVDSVANIGLLSSASINMERELDNASDTGAGRVLLEEHFLFDVIDREMDFARYKMLILPDDIRIDNPLKAKLDVYLAQGGKLFLSGESGLMAGKDEFAFDIGAGDAGAGTFKPDYVRPVASLAPRFVSSPLVMYLPARQIKVTTGQSLGRIYHPYFNRTYKHFCSHQHAPSRTDPSDYDCGVINGRILYLAHPVFKLYRGLGAVAYRQYVANAINLLLAGDKSLETNLPSTGRVTLMEQKEHRRYVLHLLYANTVLRGGVIKIEGSTFSGQSQPVEVIEDLLAVRDITVRFKFPHPISKVTLEPQGQTIPFHKDNDWLTIYLNSLTCHQMVVLSK